ncbi:MAG: hypothetical protein IT343_07770 [Candidatus Melainabacteria bacterium]|jgi:hypothetical protein|nr:hypothetical protein [Candidatus Melainabacteria bacterium]
MTEPVSNVMLVITTYTPVVSPAPAIEINADWCLELAASVDAEVPLMRAKYIFETLALHPTRRFAAQSACGQQTARSFNSPYFRLLKARARRVQQQPRSPVSSLKLALNPACRAYLKLDEQKNFAVKPSGKKLRQLVCAMSEEQKTSAAPPQDAVRTNRDPVRTVRLQPFFVAQPMFSPA